MHTAGTCNVCDLWGNLFAQVEHVLESLIQGPTMSGRWEDGLLDLEVVGGIGVGMMCQHFGSCGFFL